MWFSGHEFEFFLDLVSCALCIWIAYAFTRRYERTHNRVHNRYERNGRNGTR